VSASASTWPTGLSGADALHRYAPAAAAILQRLVRTLSTDPDRVALVRRACAQALGLPPLPPPPDADPLSATEGTILRFAEQFSVDVSDLGDELRSDLWTALNEGPREARGRLLAMTWVADFVPRVQTVLDRLFGPTTARDADEAVERVDDATSLGREFVRVVHNLHGLDPVLSELVRLRIARAHDCRMCKSLRTRSALAAGATEGDLTILDDHDAGDLSPTRKAAIALVDGILWSPARIPVQVIEDVRAHFSPTEAVELVLDVMRNSWNKTTVAAQLDEPHVTEGIEVYEYNDDGTLEFFPPGAEATPPAAVS
jgi:AhpD family alkylhydroperoxidase